MIHPSYVELMKVVNNDVEIGEEPVGKQPLFNRNRNCQESRQIIAGAEPMAEKATCPKPLSIAVEELYEGKVEIVPESENQE